MRAHPRGNPLTEEKMWQIKLLGPAAITIQDRWACLTLNGSDLVDLCAV